MASVLDVDPPEVALAVARRRCEELDALVHALVHHAGGEVELSMGDFLPKRRHELQRHDLPRGAIGLRLVDPNAPVEGGHYWVRTLSDRNPGWKPATFMHGSWWIAGFTVSLAPAEIGPRMEPPTAHSTAGR